MTICTYGEDTAPGAGCIKPAGHDGAHCVVPGELDDGYCPAEYPDPDGLGFVVHLCDRRVGHPDGHVAIAGPNGRQVELRWTNAAPGGAS